MFLEFDGGDLKIMMRFDKAAGVTAKGKFPKPSVVFNAGEEKPGGMILHGKSYAGYGNTDSRRKDGSTLPFLGGTCPFCYLAMSIGSEGFIPIKDGYKVLEAAHRDCLANAMVGKFGQKVQSEAISFLGKADLEDRHTVVHAAMRRYRLKIRSQ